MAGWSAEAAWRGRESEAQERLAAACIYTTGVYGQGDMCVRYAAPRGVR